MQAHLFEQYGRYSLTTWPMPICTYKLIQQKKIEERVFLITGADLNAQDKCGATPLLLAAACGCVHIVKMLLNAGPQTRNLLGL